MCWHAFTHSDETYIQFIFSLFNKEVDMNENETHLEGWRRLFDAAIQLKKIAPWQWMEETDVFGVKNPDTEETGFVSVMGSAGEHFAVGVYLGDQALYDFWDLQMGNYFDHPERVLEIPQLQVSFENRDALEKHDYQIIKKLGLKFRGKNSWPCFQSYRPGYFPWMMDANEVRFMYHVLEQTKQIALLFKEDSSLLEAADDTSYMIRVPNRQNDGSLIWNDHIIQIPPPEPIPIPVFFDSQDLDRLKRMPKGNHTIELDFFMFPAQIGDKGDRPACTYLMLMLETQSNMLIGVTPMIAEPSLEDMWGEIPGLVISHLIESEIRPKELRIRSDLLFELLQPLKKELGFRLNHPHKLKRLESAKEEILTFFEENPSPF